MVVDYVDLPSTCVPDAVDRLATLPNNIKQQLIDSDRVAV